jgi:hypothetical protein
MKKFPILIILLLAISFLSFSASATLGYINACGTIQYDGEYILNQSISSSTTCLTITASNVTINLSEYRITTSGSGHIAIYLNNNSTSGTYYIFGGELFPAYSVANTLCLYSNGGTLSLKNIRCLAGGSGFVFLNTNVIIIDSSYAGSFLPIQISSSTGEYYQLNINNSNISTLAAYSYIRDIGTFPNLNRSIMKIFNSRFTGSSTYFLYNTLGNSLNNDSQIVNCYFGNASTTFLNGFRGNLSNAYKGNYYASGGFGYSEVCDDGDSNGICDIPNNFSTSTDYYPIKNISLLSIPVDTSFSWNPNNLTIILPSLTSDYFNIARCSNPSDSDYLFCDNFEYTGELSANNGWNYETASNATYIPNTAIIYQGNSFKLNSSKGGIYHTFYATTDSSAVAGTEEIYEGGVLVKTVTYSNPKLNVKKIKTSFYLKTNYTPSLTDASGIFWGINDNPITNDTMVDYNQYMYLDHTKNYILYNPEVNGTKTLKFYTFNFTSESYYSWLSINPAPTTSVKVDNYLYFENNTCFTYDTITTGGTSYTSALRHAGYAIGDISIYGEYLIDSPCTSFKSIYFRTTAQNSSNPGLFLIDQPEVHIEESTSNLNLRVFDCSTQNTFITLCDDYWMTNNCINVSTSNVLPIAATVIVDGKTYTATSQGYTQIIGLATGTYSVQLIYGNVTNTIIAATNNTNAYRDVCFFSSGSPTLPPGTNEFADKVSDFLAKYGVTSSASKLLIAIVVMIVLSLIIVFSLPAVSFVIVILLNVLMIVAFTALGFIPVWAVVLIAILALALVLPKLIGGQG